MSAPAQTDPTEGDPRLRVIKQTTATVIQPVSKPRVTALVNVYHQMPNQEASQYTNGWWEHLETDDQAFGPRRVKIGVAWTPVEMGWVKTPGLIIFTNTEGTLLSVKPTPDEQKAIDGRVLVLGVGASPDNVTAVAYVRPKRSTVFEPFPGLKVYVRALVEQTGCCVWVCPS